MSVDLFVSMTPKETLKITSTTSKDSKVLYKKWIYPYKYMNSLERLSERMPPYKEMFYSNLNGKHITDQEYAYV